MNPAAGCLDYEAGPPLHVPLGFFMVASVFGVAAGAALMLWPEALLSRWHPAAFALTHLIAVGFMLTVMMGALYQILPVVAGAAVAGGGVVAAMVLVGWSIGAAALSWGLAHMQPFWLELAGNVLAPSFGLFLIACMFGLWRRAVAMTVQRDLRFALGGLAAAVMLGTSLALTLARGLDLPFAALLDLHVAWALLGGTGVLLGAASWIVVPMFQITPAYHASLMRWWVPALLCVLLAWSLVRLLLPEGALETLLRLLLMTVAAGFVAATLRLQSRSRKTRADATGRGFRLGMICLAAALAVTVLATFIDDARLPVLIGVLVLYGGFTGVIQAMLYKIVPFLAWLDLSQAGLRAPNMKQLLPDTWIRWQGRAHMLGLALVLLAVLWPGSASWPTLLAGALLSTDFAALLWLQWRVWRRVRHERRVGRTRPNGLVATREH